MSNQEGAIVRPNTPSDTASQGFPATTSPVAAATPRRSGPATAEQ